MRKILRPALLPLVALSVVAALVWFVSRSQALPDQPQPIAWHKTPCAHCQMLVGEPPHAAQLITTAGEVLAFDDPGCALRFIDERHPDVHRLWFHASAGDEWIPAERVRFTTGHTTPMASGLVAIDPSVGTPPPGALDMPGARIHAARRLNDHGLPGAPVKPHGGAP